MTPRPPRPPAGEVTVWAEGEPAVTMRLMAEPEGSRGAGGWNPLEREGDVAVDSFKGRDGDSFTFQLRIEQRPNRSVEGALRDLIGLGRPEKGHDTPGGLWIIGDGIPYRPNELVKIDGAITLGKRRTVSQTDRRLKYQDVTVVLSEFVRAGMVENATPRRSRNAKGERRIRTIKTRQGDTMRTVAVAELGDASRWDDLREWNPGLRKTDPDARLRPRTKIIIK